VFASFFNLQTQALKMQAFAPQSEETSFPRGARWGSKGEPLGVFSSPILCDKAKNRHQPHTKRAQLDEVEVGWARL